MSVWIDRLTMIPTNESMCLLLVQTLVIKRREARDKNLAPRTVKSANWTPKRRPEPGLGLNVARCCKVAGILRRTLFRNVNQFSILGELSAGVNPLASLFAVGNVLGAAGARLLRHNSHHTGSHRAPAPRSTFPTAFRGCPRSRMPWRAFPIVF